MVRIKNRLFCKLLAGGILLSVLPIAVSSILSYNFNYEAVRQQTIEQSSGSLQMGMRELTYCIDQWQSAAMKLYENQAVISILKSPEIASSSQRYTIYQHLQQVVSSQGDVEAAVLQSSGNTGMFSYSNLPLPSQSEIINQIKIPQGNDWTFALSSYRLNSGKGSSRPQLLSMTHRITDVPNYNTLGYITLIIKPTELDRINSYLSDGSKGEAVYMWAYQGDVCLYPPDMQNQDLLLPPLVESGNYRTKDGTFIFNRAIHKNIPLILGKLVPDSVLHGVAAGTLRRSLMIPLIFLPVIVVLILFFSWTMVRPIRRLSENIGKLEQGTYRFSAPAEPKDELEQLEVSFQIMAKRLDYLINNEYRNTLELSKARLKMLQAQINPHFLYNMLQYISMTALVSGADDVCDRISELSSIFRYNMDTDRDIVTLEEELEHINNYMNLQRNRFEEKLSFQVEADEKALNQQIPKMILQPLLENSIKSTVEKGISHGEINLSLSCGDKLVIRVSDNGVGISEEKLSELRSRYDNYGISVDAGRGIGLINVLQRLKIYSDSNFSWEIKSKAYERTEITVTIPVKQKEAGK